MTIKQQGGIFGRNPTYNDVTVDGSISVDTISEKTSGSGVTIDGFQAINGGAVASANSPKIELSSANANGYNYRLQSSNSGYFTLTQADGSVLTGDGTVLRYNPSGYFDVYQNLAMANGKGIDFSATSGTGTSELFDDYEEGTWTPAFSGGDYTFTYNKQKGSYTKIGNRVYVDMVLYVHPSTAPSGTVDGNLSVTGLPYAFNKQNDVESVGGIVTFKQLFLSATETVATRLSDTGTSFLLYSTLATNYPDSGFVQASSVGANARIRIQFSYPTNG